MKAANIKADVHSLVTWLGTCLLLDNISDVTDNGPISGIT